MLIKQGCFDADSVNAINAAFLTAQLGLGLGAPQALVASAAINPNVSGSYMVLKAGVAAITLAAPIAGAPAYNQQGVNSGGNDGVIIVVQSNTANAHTLTATGLFQDGAGHVNLATFAANAGATIVLQAYGGKWNVISLNAVTMS